METLLEERLKAPDLPQPQVVHNAVVLPFRAPQRFSDSGFTEPQFSDAERIHWLEAHGQHCMSYSTLQPGMRYFDLPGVGFVAYRDCFGERIVLSDPICAPHLRVLLISEFLKASPKRTSFVQITPPVAQILAQQFEMYTTEFGQETIIHLKDWSLRGKKKQVFRTALNQAEKLGIEIMETFNHSNDRLGSRDDEISDNWLSTRRCKNNEINFLIRPKVMEHQKDVRRFYGFKDLQPIGFVHFDPIYQQGKVIGYVPNISRANHLFKQGLFYAIMAVALEQFKQEGVRIVNLGLSPLHLKASLAQSRQPQNKQSQNKQPQNELSHRDQMPGLRPSKVLTRTFQLTQQYGRQFYNFQGIQFTKQRFKGEEHPSYVASRQRLPWKAFLACFRLSNLI